ncbi:MAG: hypothetical protein HY402_02335 [Elusimicrobia bacterium]|nr:hypothetical protein [Elusimicrobiota bacterium]
MPPKRFSLSLFLLMTFAPSFPGAFESAQAVEAIALGKNTLPYDVAVSSSGAFYVTHPKGHALLILDPAGSPLKTLDSKGTGPGSFKAPRGVSVSPRGWVYVVDSDNHRIQVFDSHGEFLFSFGKKGKAEGDFRKPHAAAVASDGRVYVADTGNHRIQVFTPEGLFLYHWGRKGSERGELKDPIDLAVDPADQLYILEKGNRRIQKFDAEGRFLAQWGIQGEGLAVDEYGFLYVTDAKENRILEIDPKGLIRGTYGRKGEGLGQLKKPSGLWAATPRILFVADSDNHRIQRLEIQNIQKKRPLSPNPRTRIFLKGPLQRVHQGLREFLLEQEGDLWVAESKGHRAVHLSSGGVVLATLGESAAGWLGSERKKEGHLDSPQDVRKTEEGKLYVADTGNRRIQVFGPDGKWLSAFGPRLGPVNLQEPVALAWDPAGFLYIADPQGKQIIRTDPSGNFLNSWGPSPYPSQTLQKPLSIDVDANGYVYVLDPGACRIAVFTPKGDWLTNFLSCGEGPQRLARPQRIAIRGDRLALADSGSKDLRFFEIQTLPSPGTLSANAEAGTVLLRWEKSPDRTVRRYHLHRAQNPGGPFQEIAATSEVEFRDLSPTPFATHYYRLAAETEKAELGVFSETLTVGVFGPSNQSAFEISKIELGEIFAANYKHYTDHPVGLLQIRNATALPYQNVKVSFTLKDFMDFPTETLLASAPPQASLEIPLKATLNNKILEVTEDTPIQAELKITYYDSGAERVQTLTHPLQIQARNAIRWDATERIGNFITPKDPPLMDFGRLAVLQARQAREEPPPLPPHLLIALDIWNALSTYGMTYLPDPRNPYEKMSTDPDHPEDYLQFPRETLRRKSGDCDDLVALFAALLESFNVPTLLVDTPGHLSLMWEAGVSDPLEAGLPPEELIAYQGGLWVPLETTLLGSSFYEALQHGLHRYLRFKKDDQVQLLQTYAAWSQYRPATLPPTHWSASPPPYLEIQKRHEKALETLLQSRYRLLKQHHQQALIQNERDLEALLQLGILEAEHKNLDQARMLFNRILSYQENHAAALNNRGNILFLQKNPAAAESDYQKAFQTDPHDAGILLNHAQLLMAKGDAASKKQAKDLLEKAQKLDPSLKAQAEEKILEGGFKK